MRVKCINKKDCYLTLKIGEIYNVVKVLEYQEDTYYILSINQGIKVSHKRFVDVSYERNKLIDYILK